MAVEALGKGKRIAIYSDGDRNQGLNSCLNYDANGCYHKNGANYYSTIQEMAIQP